MAANARATARALIRANAATINNPTGGFAGPPVTAGNVAPLLASYQEWSTGRGLSALPRDYSTFLAGSFGPLAPMIPTPIDQPPDGAERPEPRRFQYPVSWNLPHGVPGDEGLKLSSFGNLRVVADAYSVARACIQVRTQEILGFEWDIVPTKDAEKKMRGDREGRREFEGRRAPVLKFFKKPDPNYFRFGSWLNAALEDLFAVDAMTFYLHPARTKGKGVAGSDLAALDAIDGTTIRPLLSLRGGKPLPPNPAYSQYLFGVPRTDLVTLLTGEDVKDMGDAKVAEYRGDQLLYLPSVTRAWTPYGFGPIERALVPITSGLQRQQYQLDYYSEGSVPGVFLSTGDPMSTPQQCRELQDALNAMAGDPAFKHKIIVIPGGAKVDPMRPTPLADQFDEIVMTQVCMAFDVMPTELGISTHGTRNAMGAASNLAKANQSINERKALKPALKWLKEIFDAIIQDVIGMVDMQWHWEGLEEGEDEASAVDVLINEVTHGGLSIDEMRVIRGHQPWGIPMTSEPVYFTATGVVPLGSIDMATGAPVGAPPANAMQAAAGVVPGAPPAFGGPGPGGPGGGPDKSGGGGGGKKKPKPNGGPAGGGAATPAHAAGQAAIAAAGHGAQMLPANPKPLPKPVMAHQDPDDPRDRKPINKMAALAATYHQRAIEATAFRTDFYEPDEPVEQVRAAFDRGEKAATEAPVDASAALRELDLIRRRLNKGGTVAGWSVNHVPTPIWDRFVADLDHAPLPVALAGARTAVKALASRQRRDTALAATQQQVINGLHRLAAGVGDGSVSTPGFVDAAVALLRDAIHEGLRLGTGHALVDAGRATQRTAWATKQASSGPGWVDGLDGRFGLYAGTIPQAYELGYGLATIGAHDDPDNIVIEWHARPDACDMCDTWSTLTWTAGTLPGMPGEGGFGKNATVCLGGQNCRCRLAYRLASPDEVAQVAAQHADRPTTPGQLEGADQRAQDAIAIRRALEADDPNAALMLVLADLADERAEQQRGWLMGLLKDILTAATRGANALRTWLVTKAAADPPDDSGPVDAEHVLSLMRQNFPDSALGWVDDAKWVGPVQVPQDRIDDDDEDSWAASHQPKRVRKFVKRIKGGDTPHPAILVQEPGDDRAKIIDGHHRALAWRKLGQPVTAYVGTVDTDGGPWDETHAHQYHGGADPANKMLGVELGKVRLPPGPRDWKEHPWSHGWVWHGPTAVGTVIDHKGFGKGHVTGTTKTRVKVMFPDGKERTFPHAAGVAAGKPTERKPHVVGEAKKPAAPRAPRKAAEPRAATPRKATTPKPDSAPEPEAKAPTTPRRTTAASGMRPATDEDRAAFREATGKPIPPAWTDVHIAEDLHNSRLLATGKDSKGRRQAIYSTAHTEDQAEAKFNRVQQFHEHLPKLDEALERDALTNDDAAALLLIRRLGMRPGSERETGAEVHAHGATNLLAKHVKVRGDTVTFNFTGKKGVDIGLRVKDPLIAAALAKRLETRKRNTPLFDTDEDRVRKYMATLASPPAGFKLKDLRTLRANAVALEWIQKRARPPKTQAQFKQWRKEVADKVSAQLGNTPAIALSAYINPTVFTPWLTDPGWLS